MLETRRDGWTDDMWVQVHTWYCWLGSIANDKLKGQSMLTTLPILQFNTTGHSRQKKKFKLVDFLASPCEQLRSN